MASKTRQRRTPRRHTVHTQDPRYNVPQYNRGENGVMPPAQNIKIRFCSNAGYSTNIFNLPETIEGGWKLTSSNGATRADWEGPNGHKATLLREAGGVFRWIFFDHNGVAIHHPGFTDAGVAVTDMESYLPGLVKSAKKRDWGDNGESYNEFRRYIAVAPSASELGRLRTEIEGNKYLSPSEKQGLREHIRARSGFV